MHDLLLLHLQLLQLELLLKLHSLLLLWAEVVATVENLLRVAVEVDVGARLLLRIHHHRARDSA